MVQTSRSTGISKWVQLTTKVMEHPMMKQVLELILRSPADVVLVNCSAGYHRAATVCGWLHGMLEATQQSFVEFGCDFATVMADFETQLNQFSCEFGCE